MNAPTPPGADQIETSLTTVQTAVAAFSQIEAGIAELERLHPRDVACLVDTPAGMKQAVAGRAAWRDPRIATEKARQSAKRPVIDLGKTIDAFAAQLETRLRLGEDHYDDQIKVEEARKEAERDRKRQEEAERINGIRRQILADMGMPKTGLPIGQRPSQAWLLEQKALIESRPVNVELYGDLRLEAQQMKVDTLDLIDSALVEVAAYERELAVVAAQRAELEDQRRRDAEERAEQRRQDEAERTERDRVAAEHRKADEANLTQARRELEQQAADLAQQREALAQADSSRRATELAAKLEEQAFKDAADAARARMERAAPAMLDALLLWRTVDASSLPKHTDAYLAAAAAREKAIGSAIDET